MIKASLGLKNKLGQYIDDKMFYSREMLSKDIRNQKSMELKDIEKDDDDEI
jgi:hypothetical protein